jgi:hypothetical protein
VYRILRPGGTIWLNTPNLASRGREIFGNAWYALDVPRHLILFNPDSLTAALRSSGFRNITGPSYNTASGFIYKRSAEIRPLLRSGRKPSGVRRQWLRFWARLRASIADQQNVSEPLRCEEITFLARKPI